jgi:signal transduction histidine kinase
MREAYRRLIDKTKEKTSRTSLTLGFALFVFAILVSAVALTALGLWILTRAGVLVDIEGDLKLGSVILFMSLISLILGGALVFLTSRFPLRPVNRLINHMNRLAAGDFKARLVFRGAFGSHPAIRELTDSVNKLAEELEHIEILRSDFINDFSHEFKTPITSISGLAGLLEKGGLDDDRRQLYLRSIREEAHRLSSLATSILYLKRVESQKILTDVSSFNLSEQLRSSVLLLEERWSRKGIELSLDFDEYGIEASEELLRQVWINLLDNAMKFADEGGRIDIDLTESSGYLTVRIGNSGSEIPREIQERIFTKFYQADASHATKGNGIGLAIVKSIIELHGGRIAVKSENNYTSMIVTLPGRQA